MTTLVIDNKPRTGRKLLKSSEKYSLLPIQEEEFISLEEFKEHFENRIYERLGMKISL
jgi:hypothetical protein